MKSSKIKSSRFDREYNGKNGVIFYHTLEMENGDTGQIGSKTMNPDFLQPGEVLYYEITTRETQQGTKYSIKRLEAPKDAGSTPPSSTSTYSGGVAKNGSFALAYAKDLACAHVAAGKEMPSTKVLEVASLFKKWLDDNS